MRRRIAITAMVIGVTGALVAGLASFTYNGCGTWAPFGCHGTDPELTRLVH